MTDAAILERFEVLHKAIDAFGECAAGGGFGQLSDDEFIDLARDLEALRRSLGTVDDAVVTDVERRELPHKQLTRTTAGFLSALWRLTAGEARQRVTAARQCGTRVAFSGEPLPPLRPHLAAARTAGVVTPAQVALIVKTLADLPPRLTPHQLDEAERSLVQAAHALNLADLKIVCDKLAFCYDQDGPAPDDQVQQARRFFDARPLADGMVTGSYRLAGVDGAKLLAFLAANAKPRPTDATGPDQRTPGQRRADAIGDLLALAARAGEHATATGTAATVQVVMTPEQFETGTGLVWTTHRQKLTVAQAFRLADQCSVGWVVHNTTGGILDYGRGRRCASPAQADALAVRDGGCAFPGCSIPPEWCERHHILEWIRGGQTAIDNLVLLCAYHHRRHLDHGWRIHMIDGIPHFTPPDLVDPLRRPMRNQPTFIPTA